MSNVVTLPVITRLNLNADRTLESLIGKLEGFVLSGWDKDGNEFFSTTFADGAEGLWLLERCKMVLMEQREE